MNVIKRDGTIVGFDGNKIKQAVLNAMKDTEKGIDKDLVFKIVEEISHCSKKDIEVEEIQDVIEKKLMSSNRKDAAKSFIIYRNERTKVRNGKSQLIQKVYERINATNVENSNANVDEKSFSGREKEASSDVQKFIALELDGLSESVAKAHKDMLVYQHDLDKAILGMHNCLNVDFGEIFKHGFNTRNGDVRPPSSFSTACQLVAVAFQCQSQVQFGGVGTIHLDYDLAPFVKKSFVKHYIISIIKSNEDFQKLNIINMSEEELDNFIKNNKKKYLDLVGLLESDVIIDNKLNLDNYHYNCAMFDLMIEGRQSAQGLFHNLNTLESRQGSQVPFTSVNIGRDTSSEGRLVTQWIFEASLNGIGKNHLTSIFPISIFQYKQGTNANKEDINYDLKQLGLKSMSKRIYPNWCNGDWSQAHEDMDDPNTFFSTMGKCKCSPCKTYLTLLKGVA